MKFSGSSFLLCLGRMSSSSNGKYGSRVYVFDFGVVYSRSLIFLLERNSLLITEKYLPNDHSERQRFSRRTA